LGKSNKDIIELIIIEKANSSKAELAFIAELIKIKKEK